ncbi:uncharacterized protein LOC129938643 [Eupeodes corollae]|uniref:uncharacterized protein LOC129938643 n=1 Tax=Eupeodes corollae TaxID=290404 RepID=UPI002490ECEA|nr:uncharacterized protein LOC129938643 [Eupeodes corollae]
MLLSVCFILVIFEELVELAYALRFIEKCHKRNRIPGIKQWQILSRPNIRNFIKHPSLEEEVHAEEVFIKAIQQSAFALEYSLLEKEQSINKGSALEALAPFIDEKGLIRVGGRIKKAEIAFDAKHQILLPKTHRFTSSVISYFHHYGVCHAGPQMVLAAVRNRYWPIGGLQLTRTIVSKCIWCFRMHSKLISQFMGSLPVDRVLPLQHKAFMVTGVDFAGPISVRHHIRCKQNKEVHLALFVCFITKAVHIELVPDRSTEAFLRALKRFISDRGRVSKMYSDNATNFVGASNYFKELKANMEKDSEIIEREFSKEFIQWSFIPPRAAHHGGLWESSKKS